MLFEVLKPHALYLIKEQIPCQFEQYHASGILYKMLGRIAQIGATLILQLHQTVQIQPNHLCCYCLLVCSHKIARFLREFRLSS